MTNEQKKCIESLRKEGKSYGEISRLLNISRSTVSSFCKALDEGYKTCPVCGAEVIRAEGESATKCIGIECPAKNLRNIVHFASREAMNIDGLGEKVIEQLMDKGYINNIADIYSLKLEDIASLKKDGKKFAENLININLTYKNRKNYICVCLFSNGMDVLGVRFNEDGNVFKKSSLLFDLPVLSFTCKGRLD